MKENKFLFEDHQITECFSGGGRRHFSRDEKTLQKKPKNFLTRDTLSYENSSL